jgi:hypothetical protein
MIFVFGARFSEVRRGDLSNDSQFDFVAPEAWTEKRTSKKNGEATSPPGFG